MSVEVLLMKFHALVLAVSTAAFLPAPALAQTGADDGYEYRFEDDPMSAVPQRELSTLVRIRTGTPRATLIRPRTHFVPELLKSVERL
jgi:hypothetical protein